MCLNGGASVVEQAFFQKPRHELRSPGVEVSALKSAERPVDERGFELTVIGASEHEAQQCRQREGQPQDARRLAQQKAERVGRERVVTRDGAIEIKERQRRCGRTRYALELSVRARPGQAAVPAVAS